MDSHFYEWVATGLAACCLAAIRMLISSYRAEKELQNIEIKNNRKAIDEVENRLCFIESVVAQMPEIDRAIKIHLMTKGQGI